MKSLKKNHRMNQLRGLFVVLLCCVLSTAEFNVPMISFDQGYSPLFGHTNIVPTNDGTGVRLLLDRFTGSGFVSSKIYKHGFFSAQIKLPRNHTAGLCVAFYVVFLDKFVFFDLICCAKEQASNGDVFEKNHDELDIEFLGHVDGKPWRFQTNIYGNGSTHRGREERYTLWFDPSKEFHRYSILWTSKDIKFFVDDTPVREVVRNAEMGGEYPSKPMQLYTTIWDASSWATAGGKYKMNYRYAPFAAEFKGLALDACAVDLIQETAEGDFCTETDAWSSYSAVSLRQKSAMRRFRRRYMYYSYCYDAVRHPVPPPECVMDPMEKQRFKESGRLKFGGSHPRRRRRSRTSYAKIEDDEDDDDDEAS